MRRKLVLAGVISAMLGTIGCSAFRPVLFWRDTLIMGQTSLIGDGGVPVQVAAAPSVSLNFINLEGRIEDSVASVQTDAVGKYRSPKLVPGTYSVEAMVPGFVIEVATVEVKNHEYKRVDFQLMKIGEVNGLSLKEAEEDNIRAPGQVKIGRPKL